MRACAVPRDLVSAPRGRGGQHLARPAGLDAARHDQDGAGRVVREVVTDAPDQDAADRPVAA